MRSSSASRARTSRVRSSRASRCSPSRSPNSWRPPNSPGVPAFVALIAFITATLVFIVAGSNPILSVGADSTIAPLFAVAILKIALPDTGQYYSLVAATALVAGVILVAIGLLKLGWLADFLSVPIVAGFLSGIGVIIIVHQLPTSLWRDLWRQTRSSRVWTRWCTTLGHVNAWSIVIALGTLAAMMLGEKVNARVPWALGAVLIGAVLAVSSVACRRHGVATARHGHRGRPDVATALVLAAPVERGRHDGPHPGDRHHEPERRDGAHVGRRDRRRRTISAGTSLASGSPTSPRDSSAPSQ